MGMPKVQDSNSSVMALNRRGLLLGLAGLALAVALPGEASARAGDGEGTFITNFNRPKITATTVTEVIKDEAEAWPMLQTSSGMLMLDAITRFEVIAAAGGWPQITVKREMRKGGKGGQVEVLRQRLFLEGYLEEEDSKGDVYDDVVQKAVAQFQRNHGLKVNGRVDGETIAEMNVKVEERLEQMRANLPRLELYARNLLGRYVVVNIPAAQMEAVNFNGKVFSRHNIIAGKPDRPSPIVSAQLSDINFNPYWNVPVSIVERDIIPAILKDKDTLKKMNIRVFDGYGGPEVDPSTVDWAKTRADRYFLRQEPGGENAMATVKINFPSPFGVYMHDTPTRQFFVEADRYLSSGCVRIDQVHLFVDWVLNGQDGWNMDRIKSVSEKVERLDVKLELPPELRWVYLTSWVTGEGQVNFRPDIYELDGTGFVEGQPTPVGQLAEDGSRWLYKMPPAPVLGAQAQASVPLSPEDAVLPPPAAQNPAAPVVTPQSDTVIRPARPNLFDNFIFGRD